LIRETFNPTTKKHLILNQSIGLPHFLDLASISLVRFHRVLSRRLGLRVALLPAEDFVLVNLDGIAEVVLLVDNNLVVIVATWLDHRVVLVRILSFVIIFL